MPYNSSKKTVFCLVCARAWLSLFGSCSYVACYIYCFFAHEISSRILNHSCTSFNVFYSIRAYCGGTAFNEQRFTACSGTTVLYTPVRDTSDSGRISYLYIEFYKDIDSSFRMLKHLYYRLNFDTSCHRELLPAFTKLGSSRTEHCFSISFPFLTTMPEVDFDNYYLIA